MKTFGQMVSDYEANKDMNNKMSLQEFIYYKMRTEIDGLRNGIQELETFPIADADEFEVGSEAFYSLEDARNEVERHLAELIGDGYSLEEAQREIDVTAMKKIEAKVEFEITNVTVEVEVNFI